jgi:hypothetical protein
MRTSFGGGIRHIFAKLLSVSLLSLFVVWFSACGTNSTSLNVGSTSTNGTSTTSGTSTAGTGTPSLGGATTPNPTIQPIGPTATSTAPQPSLQAVTVRHTFDSIAPNTASPITDIACPAGYLVVSGGLLGGDGGKMVPVQDAPANTTTWAAEIFNGNNSSEQPTFGIECLKATGVALVSKIVGQNIGNIAPQTMSGFIYLTCPAGYIASGGGFSSGSPNYTIANNAPSPNTSNTTTWLSEVYNTGNSLISVVAETVCLSAPNLHQKIVTAALNNGPLFSNVVYQATTLCPAYYVLGGGGIDSGYPDFYAPIDGPNDTREWGEYMFYSGSNTAEGQIDARCLKIG